MSYCVHCGVELVAGEKACPLCGTPVYDPTDSTVKAEKKGKPFYPAVELPGIPKVSRRSILALFAVLLLIPSFVTLVCDFSLTGSVSWSAYVLGASASLLITVFLILCSRRLRSYGVVLISGAIWIIYAFFVRFWSTGHIKRPFSLSILLYLTFAIALLCFLIDRRKTALLKLIAIGILLTGGLCLLIEWQINAYFQLSSRLVWSYYPAGTGLLLSLLLLIIDRSEAMKAKLRKKFFI